MDSSVYLKLNCGYHISSIFIGSPDTGYQFIYLLYLILGHVGVQSSSEKVFWEFDSIIMRNLSDILPLFCAPTWLSHHVSENQEYGQGTCRSSDVKRPTKAILDRIKINMEELLMLQFLIKRLFYSDLLDIKRL